MFAAPTYAPAQLVQLREPEPLGRFDDHDRGVRHVDAYFDDRRGDHDIGLARLELAHRLLLVGGFHLAVANRGDILRQREIARYGFVAVGEVFVIHGLGLLDERIYDIDLPSLGDLLLHEAEQAQPRRIGVMYGLDRPSSRRKLVDHRDVEVAVEGHGQRAGNRRGGHHEDVRRLLVFGPEPGALLHAEAVLLVDHHEPQVGELHPVFDQGVRADQDVHLARGDPFERQPALPGLRGAGEDGDLHPHAVEHTRDGGEMLAGEDLGGRHHAGLVAVVHGQQHRHQRHEGLAAADVALQQAVHLVARDGVLPDLPDDPFLRSGERER